MNRLKGRLFLPIVAGLIIALNACGGRSTLPAAPSSGNWTPTAANWQCPSPPAATLVGSSNPLTGWDGTCTLASGEVCSGSAGPTGFAGTCTGGSPSPGGGTSGIPQPGSSALGWCALATGGSININLGNTTCSPTPGQPGATVSPQPGTPSSPSATMSSAPVSGESPSASGATTTAIMAKVTFYGKTDVCPNITCSAAYTGPISTTEDGSYGNPLTLATVAGGLPVNTIVYVKALQRYFIHTDTCGSQCTGQMDLWVGSAPNDVPCANQLMAINSVNGETPVILNPPNNLQTIVGPLWDGTTCNMPPTPYPTS